VRILEVAGLDYAKVGPKVTDSEGKQVSHKSQGSVYFVSSFYFLFPLTLFLIMLFFSPTLTFFMGLFFPLFFYLVSNFIFFFP
jgi:hypothetical protein